MPKRATPLTAHDVLRAKPGRHFDGDGLILLVRQATTFKNGKVDQPGKAWWLYRYTLKRKTRDLGLGRAMGPNSISLAEARTEARKARDMVKGGLDPLAEREAEEERKQAAAALAAANAVTFEQAANFYIAANEAAWRNPKHRQQWKNTLRDYVNPTLGSVQVGMVDTGAISKILEPLWIEKPETASRVRGRIETVLNYAKTKGWRSGENPARWRGHLANILPARAKVRRVEHHAALPWREAGAFMEKLRAQNGMSPRAAEFAILTAARSSEARGARWNEIDLGLALWTIPATRMKADREHRVPLSPRVVEILKGVADLKKEADSLVFPGPSGELSDVALSKAVKAAAPGVTMHGFRSTFRTWCAEFTHTPRELAEAALAHTNRNKVEAAYARGDLFEKRRRLMNDWAKFCARPMVESAEVTQMRAVGVA